MICLSLVIFALANLSPNVSAQPKSKNSDSKGISQATTNLDFDSTLIDGKMKSPSGFFLQGRNRQSMSNMVKLRSQFNKKLRNSKSAVKLIVK